jgi:hypothetical protein
LEKAAAGACLGGFENTSTQLEELTIRFGELIHGFENHGVKRAGFGTLEETAPLTSGAMYGAVG